jgi:hypothetical protein
MLNFSAPFFSSLKENQKLLTPVLTEFKKLIPDIKPVAEFLISMDKVGFSYIC